MVEKEGRVSSLAAKLAKLGVSRPDSAANRLAEYPELAADAAFLDELGLAADPDLALETAFEWWNAATPRLQTEWQSDPALRARFLLVAGASEALGGFLKKHPNAVEVLTSDGPCQQQPTPAEQLERLLAAVGARQAAGRWLAAADDQPTLESMRIAYKRELLLIAARDLSAVSPLDETALSLSSLADAVVESALAVAWASVNPGEPVARLAVIALGKCGGRELNYISDVDVVFVAESAGSDADFLPEATRLAARLMQVCEQPTAEGSIWQVDAALRPEGKAGALVRTLEAHVSYYQRWAETWEFQALLKAREMAGDMEIARQYVDAISPFIWRAAERPNFVSDVQAMRQRVVANIPGRDIDRELKLGVGGLRDIEFAVQLLQLVHGRSDAMLRSANTLQALEALATWGYVGRDDAAQMSAIYRFERTLEHRIQMHQMLRTHLLPESDADWRRLGRSMGMRNDPAQALMDAWQRYRMDARRLHEKLFYRPLLQAVVRLDAADARLSPEAASDRLRALGFNDPESAIRHLTALSAGVSRRAAIQRTLLPVMLQWMAETPTPDAGLLAFRRVSEALGATPWYLRLLRDESLVAERMARLLSISAYFTDLLLRAPEAVSMLADDEQLKPRSRTGLQAEMNQVAARQDNAAAAVAGIRAIRQRELIRISAADLLGLIDLAEVCQGLTALTEATLHTSLTAVLNEFWRERPRSLNLSIIGLGRLGGAELNYASDADICVVYEPLAESAGADALSIMSQLQHLLGQPASDPPLQLDLDLRPEGRQGPIARSLDSYRAYYERWSLTWESQALLRARWVAGDPELGFEFEEIIDGLRYPKGGLDEIGVREIRRIKARVEAERLPRGANPALHVKLGPGGISDVEWTVQLAQLQFAGSDRNLRSTGTLSVLPSMVKSGIISFEDAELLAEAWRMASRIRNGNVLGSGKASDQIPSLPPELRLLAFILGESSGAELTERYRRAARRARAVMERQVYGQATKTYP